LNNSIELKAPTAEELQPINCCFFLTAAEKNSSSAVFLEQI
jgi:hypothetical protein